LNEFAFATSTVALILQSYAWAVRNCCQQKSS
jgi:hypothetical protein